MNVRDVDVLWTEAKCRGVDSDVFFEPENYHQAVMICRRCPVRMQCLEYALSFQFDLDRYGIFGGQTPDQRAMIRRNRRRGL